MWQLPDRYYMQTANSYDVYSYARAGIGLLTVQPSMHCGGRGSHRQTYSTFLQKPCTVCVFDEETQSIKEDSIK